MKVIVIGGGKVGFYLIKTLKNKKHDITLIEKDKKLCEKISDEIDIEIINGDGTDIEVLKDADIEVADVVAAVTGKDEENLIICQVSKKNFDIQHTIARVNNPKNQKLFKLLGVDSTVCSTQVITNLIEWECESDKIKIIQTFERGEMVLVEAEIDKKIVWCNKAIKDIKMPIDSVIVSIFREGHVIYPKGDTIIQEHDKVVLVTDSKNMVNENKKAYSVLEKYLFKN